MLRQIVKGLLVLLPFVALAAAIFLGVSFRRGPYEPYLCTMFQIGCPAVTIGGVTAPGFEGVRESFADMFKNGRELGAQVCAYVDGKMVVDLYGAYGNGGQGGAALKGLSQAPPAAQAMYNGNSLQNVFSSGKVIESVVAAMAVSRGYFSYSDTVASIWPEFGQNGKDRITVSDVLRHDAGLPFFAEMVNKDKIGDLDYMADLIARSPPHFPPGHSERIPRMYHAMTRGWIVSELIRRRDPKHRSLGVFARQELFDPLDVDFFIGDLPLEQEYRAFSVAFPNTAFVVTNVVIPSYLAAFNLSFVPTLSPSLLQMMKISRTPNKSEVSEKGIAISGIGRLDIASFVNTRYSHTVEISSANSLANARAMARIAMMMANGGSFGGMEFIREEVMKDALSDMNTELDLHLGLHMTMTKGGLGLDYVAAFAPTTTGWYGWGGYGGSLFFLHPTKKASYAFAMNHLSIDLVDTWRIDVFDRFLEALDNALAKQ